MRSLAGSESEVIVVGGGPAGLAAAIAMRLKGFDVTVAEGGRPPLDKACGEGLLPAGLEALRRLGVPLAEDDGFPIHGIRFLCGELSAEAKFRSACGLGLRRTRLHGLLVRRAADVGVRLLWGTTVRDVPGLTARWIVGADGQQSCVRREARLDATRSLSTRFGFRRHYRLSPWSDMVEVYWGARCQIYVTPVSAEDIGVALLARDSHLRLDSALYDFPELQRRLQNAALTSMERGAATQSRRLWRVFRGHTALIGDASGSVDAITGDGLSLAFLQAHALADALAVGDLRLYQAEHRRMARNPALMAKALLLLDRFPRLRRGVLHGLAFEPSVFNRLLAMHASA